MEEILMTFAAAVVGADGTRYTARACGAENPEGLWHGWIEFKPAGEGGLLRTPRETTQPNRVDLAYWATGLEPIYLEGALERAVRSRTG